MRRAIKWIFYAACMVLRGILILIGYVFPVHIFFETERTKGLNLWERYIENAWRNPTPYLRSRFVQPIPEIKPNPDQLVRVDGQKKATRLMESGPYIEYWSLSAMESGKFWEFRIGWKFVDAEPTFWPTFQLGPKK